MLIKSGALIPAVITFKLSPHHVLNHLLSVSKVCKS